MSTVHYEGSEDDKPPVIQLTNKNMVKGQLKNGQNVTLLYDSGATKTLISESFIEGSNVLSSEDYIPIRCTRFQIGNGDYIVTKYAIKFKITI